MAVLIDESAPAACLSLVDKMLFEGKLCD